MEEILIAGSKTKAYHRFKQRCDYYEVDVELCDLLVRQFIGMTDSNDKLAVALGSDATRHPKLDQRNSKRTREVRGGHLRRTMVASAIKDLYEDFVEFISETMAKAALKGVDPGRFAGGAKFELNAKEVLGLGDWDSVVTLISQKIFRQLEGERKTMVLITKAAKHLGLTIDQAVIDGAFPYLETRHLLVHQDGRADADFRGRFGGISVREGKINLTTRLVTDARLAVDALAKAFDVEIISKGLVRAEHLCP